MSWHAIVPIKALAERKTRLAGALSADERRTLSESMFQHVLGALQDCSRISQISVLSKTRPPAWTGDWICDAGQGLNRELARARAQIGAPKLMVIHADLPLLQSAEVAELAAAAELAGSALAPDRHGSGTNAVALCEVGAFTFRFGPQSFALHRAQLPDSRIVATPGLASDVDTPEDLALTAPPS